MFLAEDVGRLIKYKWRCIISLITLLNNEHKDATEESFQCHMGSGEQYNFFMITCHCTYISSRFKALKHDAN